MRTEGFKSSRGFDVASNFVLLVDESLRCVGGVREDERSDACCGCVWVCCAAVVCECAGERAARGGGAFDLVMEDRNKDQVNTLGRLGRTLLPPYPFNSDDQAVTAANRGSGFFFGVDQVAVGG